METFYTKFKENLAAAQKEGEKKEIKFEIKGGNDQPSGIGLQMGSVNKDTYKNYIATEPDYMKDALTVATVTFGIKDAAQAEVAKNAFDQFKPMIDEIPIIKPYLESKKVEYFLRVEGTKVSIDVVFRDEMAYKKLQEIGVDFSDYQSFKFLFRTGLKADEIFGTQLEQICEKVLSLLFCVEGTTTNAKFLITALLKTLLDMDLKEEKQKKRLKKLKIWLTGVLAFMKANFDVQYDPKECTNTLFETKMVSSRKDEINGFLEMGKTTMEGFGETGKGVLEGFGMYETAKAACIDEINISLLSVQYKNGFAFNLYLPGVTKFINEKFLSA